MLRVPLAMILPAVFFAMITTIMTRSASFSYHFMSILDPLYSVHKYFSERFFSSSAIDSLTGYVCAVITSYHTDESFGRA